MMAGPHVDGAAIIAYLGVTGAMPTLRRFAACKIAIYADDHMPRHFHIEGRGFRAVVEIDTMRVRAGDARRGQEALAWARANREQLRDAWNRINQRG